MNSSPILSFKLKHISCSFNPNSSLCILDPVAVNLNPKGFSVLGSRASTALVVYEIRAYALLVLHEIFFCVCRYYHRNVPYQFLFYINRSFAMYGGVLNSTLDKYSFQIFL